MNLRPTAALLCLLLAACGKSSAPSGAASSSGRSPSAAVVTQALEKSTITATITAYGTVVAQPGELESVAVQYECRVTRLLVSAGEPVEKGTKLIDVAPSPDAELALANARSAAKTSETRLAETRQRFEAKLAVNQELQQAEQGARDARAMLDSLQGRIAVGPLLAANVAGVVGSISAGIGQLVPAGSPLLTIVPGQRIEVRLGVEPEDAERLRKGQQVKLSPVNQDGIRMDGQIRLVTRRVNPRTRLIDTFVSVPPENALLLGGYVRGEITTETKQALVVPRDAVLPTADGSVLFTVKDGKAVRQLVTVGLETDTQTEVSADSLQAGDEVVIVGNHQLEDGMSVTLETSAKPAGK